MICHQHLVSALDGVTRGFGGDDVEAILFAEVVVGYDKFLHIAKNLGTVVRVFLRAHLRVSYEV